MPDQQIPNSIGAWTAGATYAGGGQQTAHNYVISTINNSAGTRTSGDVVVMTDVTGVNATTTTTVNDKTVIGIVATKSGSNAYAAGALPASTYAVGQEMPVIIMGIGRVNIASNTVAAGDVLTTSAAAGVAQTNAGDPVANAVIGSLIGIALEANGAKDTNNTIRAKICNF